MEKHVIKVPKGIRYIGDWEEFNDIFPKEPHIMDKNITGCGFTEWCIRNQFNVILCSPRNILLDNKAAQHPGEVYRIKSSYFDKELGVDKDTTKTKAEEENEEDPEKKIPEDEKENILNSEQKSFYCRISEELEIYSASRGIQPKKILVTYDSFHVLRDVLKDKGLLESFFIIVDEFQSIFTDARFKSEIEMGFVEQLQGLKKVCYLSATPMLDKYMEEIPEFKNLPYYELDWRTLQPDRMVKPDITVRIVNSIYQPIKEIISQYKEGNFEDGYRLDKDGRAIIVQSKELVVYVNSVYNIIQIIKKSGLKPEECNILCASTPENLRKIQNKLGVKWTIGSVPLEGEERKMFTFCTRTVYLGADFYSDNARSVILSDANVDCLAVDISLDLPQILGRQRLEINPWKNSAEFYYKSLTDKNKDKMTEEKFNAVIAEKKRMTESLLHTWNQTNSYEGKKDLLRVYEDRAKDRNYSSDYISINRRKGAEPVPALNNLVLIAEKRAFEIQQTDYADRFSVMNNVLQNTELNDVSEEIDAFFLLFDNMKTYKEKLQFFYETDLSEIARSRIKAQLQTSDKKMKKFMIVGKDRLKALGYNPTYADKELGIITFSPERLKERVQEEFHKGNRIAKSEIKERLAKIYDELGYQRTAKATDIEEWFMVKSITIITNKKKINGFEILNLKV